MSQADRTWYLSYGSVFNTLQTDVAKVNRTLGTVSQDLSKVHPYWQGLLNDVMTAMALPPIPDDAAQSSWTAALGNLSQGATQCINGTPSSGVIPATLYQGVVLIAAGAAQLNDAFASIQGQAAAGSGAVADQVRAWKRSYGSLFTTLQTDLNSLNAVFATTSPSQYATVDPYWQQLFNDANGAAALPPIPDALAQSYWSSTLNDLVQGTVDCITTSEALPPNLFDQGVALLQSGTSYLGTSVGAVQALAG